MSDETEAIKERINLAEIVREYVQLKQAGRHWRGLCPFHKEKTPSFIVSPDKGIWHCFGGCNEGGDVFSFIQKMEKIDFPAALKMLAERTGVTLKGQREEQSPEYRQKERLFELLNLTARFYHEILLRQSTGAKAREYLRQRGVREETIRSFMLGYAPKSWDTLQLFLRHKGFSPREMAAAGIAGESAGGKLYDRFRGRIIWPIEDMHSRVVAFGGRIAPWHATGDEGKYINSPETSFYEKRRVVYNLNRAKAHLRGEAPVIVVEGYMDVIMLAQAGYANVVASSGTAFTAEALQQLGRFTNILLFAFDADDAGVKANIAATQSSLAAGMKVATLVFPSGADPADVALANPAALDEIVRSPRPLAALLVERMKAAGTGADKYLAELMPLVARVSNPVQQGEMVREISQALFVPAATVITQLEKFMAGRQWQLSVNDPQTEKGKTRVLTSAEQQLLGILISWPQFRRQFLSNVSAHWLEAEKNRELLAALQSLVKEDETLALEADELIDRLPSDLKSLAEGLRSMSEEMLASSTSLPENEAQSLLDIVKKKFLGAELKRLQQELGQGTAEQREQLMRQFLAVTQELAQAAP